MADDFSINIDGLDEFLSALADGDDAFLQAVEKGITTYTTLVETGATALAHRFSGELEESIKASAVAVQNGMVISSVGTNLSYAWRLHERPIRSGVHDLYDRGAHFPNYYLNGRGERTRQKRTWRGQMPGRKFLERAVVATEGDFETILYRALDEFLGGLL